METIFHRRELAGVWTKRLLHPGPLDLRYRSGLFISGIRRIGKTTFLHHDLIPALEAAGALVVYVDLWAATGIEPEEAIRRAVKHAFEELRSPTSKLLPRLKQAKVGLAVGPLKLDIPLDGLGTPSGPSLAEAFVRLVDELESDVVLVIDEVQHALTTDAAANVMFALKAARDAVNIRPQTAGHFLLVGTGSHRSLVNEMARQRKQPFAGAVSEPFPPLGEDFVQFVLQQSRQWGIKHMPSLAAATEVFEMLGARPEDFQEALGILDATSLGADVDHDLRTIARTLRTRLIDQEFWKVERMGPLAMLVFSKLAEEAGEVRGLFSADALAEYGTRLNKEVTTTQVQDVVEQLIRENLVMRQGHGRYELADPFVRQIWEERRHLRGPAGLPWRPSPQLRLSLPPDEDK